MNEPAFPARWDVGAPVLVTETFSSHIWRVTRADGGVAIVKALKDFPDVYDELRGAHYLDWRDGHGAVRLFDIEGRQMLLEDAGDTLLTGVIDRDGDRAATEIAAEVMAELFSASERATPADLQPLRERFASLFAKATADAANGVRSLYVEAADVAERLLSAPRDTRPLHGDLHHDNLLLSPRGWLAIDAKGLLGDPAFDAANFFFNPLDRQELTTSDDRTGEMTAIFAGRLGIDPRHLLDYAFAWGALSSSWHAEDGNSKDEESELAVARTVRRARRDF